MTPSRTLCVLTIMIALILGAGCLGPADTGDRTIPVTITNDLPATQGIQSTPIAAQAPILTPSPVPIYCPQRGNESSWITLSPVSDLRRGDPFEIRGETNLPVGEHVGIQIYEASFHPHCKCCYDDDLRAVATVYQGSSCNHSFAISLDSTNLRPQDFLVQAQYGEGDVVSSNQLFTLFQNNRASTAPIQTRTVGLPANTSLTLDPIQDVKQGEPLVITGYTDKYAAILYSVRDARYSPDLHHPNAGELAGGIMYPFAYGEDPRPFSFRFNTSSFGNGGYVFSLDSPCTGESVEKSFTIIP